MPNLTARPEESPQLSLRPPMTRMTTPSSRSRERLALAFILRRQNKLIQKSIAFKNHSGKVIEDKKDAAITAICADEQSIMLGDINGYATS
jgi:hypothetical protein